MPARVSGVAFFGAAAGATVSRATAIVALVDLAAAINAEHAAALQHAGQAMSHALHVGELLLQSKEICKHGQWLPWLREHVSFSERTAQGYMRLLQRRDIRNGVADMSVRQALQYLATPRRSSFEDDLKAWMAACPPEKLVTEWSLEDAAVCGKSIRAFDEIMHKHGLCDGSDDIISGLCSVCGIPPTVAVAAERNVP